jgi:hypothetical protein
VRLSWLYRMLWLPPFALWKRWIVICSLSRVGMGPDDVCRMVALLPRLRSLRELT